MDGQRREQQGGTVAGGEFLGCWPSPLAKPRVCVWDEQVEDCDETGSQREAEQHLAERAAVERGEEQAKRGRREHHPGSEAEQRVEGERARAPKDEHGNPTEPSGKPRNDQPQERLGVQWRAG